MSRDILQMQSELYNALKSTGVDTYDYTPDDCQYPFIRLGTSYGSDRSTKITTVTEITQYIDVFSNYKGQKEIREIVKKVFDAVDNAGIKYNKRNIELTINQHNELSYASDGRFGDSLYQANIVLKITT